MNHPSRYPTAIATIAVASGIITILPARPVHADPVEDLVTFSAGTTARADEVNANFSEVTESVNDNDARVAALEAEIIELREQLNPEPFHVVGQPGEPAFGNGGQGDCLWLNTVAGFLDAANPTSFYKGADGIVHLAGLPAAIDGGGGDGICGSPPPPPESSQGSTTDLSDVVIFQLPDGYQPEHLEVFASADSSIGLNFIAPQGGLLIDGQFIAGGSVFVNTVADEDSTNLDGITFRAAPAEATLASAREPISVSLHALRALLD